MKTVIYTCPYVPAEWIAAHRLRPHRIIPRATGPAQPLIRREGLCPYVRRFLNEVITSTRSSGVVVTTVCDQMRRAFDILTCKCDLPAFMMNVPNTWQNPETQKLYIDELKRLGRFLVSLGGKSPSNDILAQTMTKYDTARTAIRAARAYFTARQYSQAIAEFNENGKILPPEPVAVEPLTNAIPLAIIGGPLLKEDFEIFDIIENAGGRVVLDATETGERRMSTKFHARKLRAQPLTALSDAYFRNIPDASRRPNTQLYDWLKHQLTHRRVRGIIFWYYVWCDIWGAERHRLRQWTDLPILDINASDDHQAPSIRTAGQIGAFLEIFR